MLDQLRKVIERSYIREKTLNLNRLSRVREKAKRHPQPNSIIRAILSYIYIQLNTRPVEKNYKKIVYSWKNSEFESTKQCERKCHKPSPSAQFSVRAIPNHIYIQLDGRPIEEGCGKIAS